MAVDAITPAILQYIDHNAYPDSEEVAAAELSSTTLQTLHQALAREQETVKREISAISKNAGSDIDTWISRAKALQADILRSRETARQIVAEAEAGQELKAQAEDRRKKVELLEKEVVFQESVQARLEHVRFARGLIEDVRERIVKGELRSGLRGLEEARESVAGLGSMVDGIGALLGKRLEKLEEQLKDSVTEAWGARLRVEAEERTAVFQGGVDDLIDTAKSLGIFDGLLSKYVKDFDRAIVRPRMIVDRQGNVPMIQVSAGQVSCRGTSDDTMTSSLFKDLMVVFDFLHQELPASIAVPFSDALMPMIANRLEEEWLEPAIPLDIADIPAFQDLLNDSMAFADQISQLGWGGNESLRVWIRSAPRTWLTKRRETVLGDARNLVFNGLREKKTVERVAVRGDDDLVQGVKSGGDDWNTAWEEPEEETAEAAGAKTNPTEDDDDDDASAWDMPDEDEPIREEGNDEDDAWGWGDGDEPAVQPQEQAPAPKRVSELKPPAEVQQQKPLEQEVTLRETFTVTAIPDGILELLRGVVADAQLLAGPEFSSSPVAPAAVGLYTLPPLALAIYRATAPTAYARVDSGNMFIYNDANHLSDQLQSWQASQAPSSRLRLDNDIKALGRFSKQAYSAEMESQRTILRDFLDGAQGFSNCTAQPYKMACEGAVEQTVDRIRDVHRQWQPVLSQSALLQSIGSLTATVTGKILREIEDLPDIGEAESKQLKLLCDRVSEVRDLFEQQAPDGSGEVREMAFIYCPNWLKFQYLAEILESSLADIKYLWKEGELSLEFEGEEVEGLIEALFAESSLRRGAIAEIRRGGRGRT